MAKLSEAQIRKLTPTERRAREKALQYKRAYHAKRRGGRKSSKRIVVEDKGMTRAEAKRIEKNSARAIAESVNLAEKIGAKVLELQSVINREKEILAEIATLVS